jgi:hypothetical protein
MNIIGAAPIIEVQYNYTFISLLPDGNGGFQNEKFLTQMQMGYGAPTANQPNDAFDYLTCTAGFDLPILNFVHGAPLTSGIRNPENNTGINVDLTQGGFAYERMKDDGSGPVFTSKVLEGGTDTLVINGTVIVNATLNRNAGVKTFDLNMTGDGLYQRDEFGVLSKLSTWEVIDIPFPRDDVGFNSIMFWVSKFQPDYDDHTLPGEPVILDDFEVIVKGTCGITIPPNSELDFGILIPTPEGRLSVERSLAVEQTGDIEVLLRAYATDWMEDKPDNPRIINDARHTRFSLEEGKDFSDKKYLNPVNNPNSKEIGVVPYGGSLDVWWQIELWLEISNFHGPATQEITLEAICR